MTITGDPSTTVPLWRIGNWDGSPNEFLNADRVTTMHPSDVRMSSWTPGTYVVGGTTLPATGIPCYQWKDVNSSQAIQFNLTASQLVNSTIRVGITTAYSGGRPNVSVNNWTAANQNASSQPNTRTLTIGSYRGNNTTYTYSVPASALVAGTNTLYVFPISGSSGTGFLSPGYSLDCIEMFQGAAVALPVPAPPGALTAAGQDAGVVLNWTAPGGAVSYKVQRASVSGGPYTTVARGVSATTYADTGLTNGVTYRYVVSGVNTSGTGLNSAEASTIPTAAPTVHLRLDESGGTTTAADATGNGWNGTLVNGPAWTAGRINNAISLNGSNQSLTLPTGVVSAMTDFSVCTWVKWNAAVNSSRIFDFGTGTTVYMCLTPRNSTSKRVRFSITTNGGTGEQKIEGTGALPTSVWTHVAVTLSGATGTLYVNGAAVGTNTAMTLTPASLGRTTQNYLGRSQFSSNPYLNGLLDEFQIYARALSPTEVAGLAAPPSAPASLTASSGDQQVGLDWGAIADASGYAIKRALVAGGPYAPDASGLTGLSFLDTGLLPIRITEFKTASKGV